MFQGLRREPAVTAAEPGREAVEAVVDGESGGGRHRPEAEPRREQPHVEPLRTSAAESA